MAEFKHDSTGRIVEHVTNLGAPGTWAGRWERYTYDSLSRLTGFRRYDAPPSCPVTDTLSEYGTLCSGGTLVAQDTFTYDFAGNRTDAAAVDWGNRLRVLDSDSMNYDLDGNLIRKFKPDGSFDQRLYWNSINQLDSVWTYRSGSGSQTVRFGYDAANRRVRKSVGADTTWYLYDGENVVAEYSKTGTPRRRYTYFPGTDRPHAWYDGGTHYYQTDGRGNVRGALSAKGANPPSWGICPSR